MKKYIFEVEPQFNNESYKRAKKECERLFAEPKVEIINMTLVPCTDAELNKTWLKTL